MTTLFLLTGLALTVVIVLKISDELSPRIRPLILAGAAVLFFGAVLTQIAPLFEKIGALFQKSGFAPYLNVLMKGAGMGFLTELAASFCRDLGEESVAGKLEIAGKCAILALALPLVGELTDIIEVLAN